MNVKQLRDESERLRLEASSNMKQAERFTYNANDFEKAGDKEKADIERAEAQKLIDAAEQANRQADEHDRGAAEQEMRAISLEKEQASIQADYDQKMKQLEHEKAQLRGGTGLFS